MPDVVELVSENGSVLISYRMDFDKNGKIVREVRIFTEKPRGLDVYEVGNIYRFSSTDNDKWQQVGIITDLDDKGRPIKVTKKVADRVEYVIKKQYRDGYLFRETIMAPDGSVRIQSEYEKDGDKVFETMRDSKGKVIMHRVLPENGHKNKLHDRSH